MKFTPVQQVVFQLNPYETFTTQLVLKWRVIQFVIVICCYNLIRDEVAGQVQVTFSPEVCPRKRGKLIMQKLAHFKQDQAHRYRNNY